ncbi:TraR/DksA C4-type zinc finger protein [Pseudomonas aeruginosa]|uniref:TraR/DksA C4-type zinc finger protein n=1 Tax=Pseudomonas aeruginosa TaxID=287 RepID=UPI003965BD79
MSRPSFADQFDRMGREVLPLGEALNLVARNQRMCHGGITGFAHSTGRSVSTTSHKFDPSHTSHILNIYDVLDFLRYVSAEGRAVVLDALHAELGDSLWFFVSPLQFEDVPASLIAGAGEILHTSANAATTIARHIEDGRIDAAELAETQKLAMSIIRAAVGLYERARYVHQTTKGAERGEAALAARALVAVGESAHECECCGEPIPPRRREAVPGCQTCIECQSFNERRGRR